MEAQAQDLVPIVLVPAVMWDYWRCLGGPVSDFLLIQQDAIGHLRSLLPTSARCLTQVER